MLVSLIKPLAIKAAETGPAQPHSSLEWLELMQDWLDSKVDESSIELHEEMDKTLETAEKRKSELKKDIEKTKKKNREKKEKLKEKREAKKEELREKHEARKEKLEGRK